MVPDRGHGSHWGVIFALFGLIGLASYAEIAPRLSKPKDDSQESSESATEHVRNSQQSAVAPPSLKSLDANVYQAPCRQPDSHDQCDLEAQWKAADSARDAADWSFWQMIFSALGLTGLIYNLILTRKATNTAIEATEDAEEALKIAKRNADAAVALVDNAKDVSRRQLRAYAFVKYILLTENGPNEQSVAAIKIHNSGGTPAYKVRCVARIDFDPDNRAKFTLPEFGDDKAKGAIADVGSDGLHTVIYVRKAKDFKDKASLLAKETYAHVYGKITYIDCFGTERNGKFHFVHRIFAGETPGGLTMEQAEKGNEYD